MSSLATRPITGISPASSREISVHFTSRRASSSLPRLPVWGLPICCGVGFVAARTDVRVDLVAVGNVGERWCWVEFEYNLVGSSVANLSISQSHDDQPPAWNCHNQSRVCTALHFSDHHHQISAQQRVSASSRRRRCRGVHVDPHRDHRSHRRH